MVYLSFFEKKRRKVCRYEKKSYLCNRNRETNNVSRDAQMAESVDALVSNTSGFTSIPVRPRVWVLRNPDNHLIIRVFFIIRSVLKAQFENLGELVKNGSV